MSAAARLIDQLHGCGVSAIVDGGTLRLRPASALPADLLTDLRTHKAAVIALLTVPADDIPHYEHDTEEIAARLNARRLPAIGTPERARLDEQDRLMCAGLMRCADVSLWMGRK